MASLHAVWTGVSSLTGLVLYDSGVEWSDGLVLMEGSDTLTSVLEVSDGYLVSFVLTGLWLSICVCLLPLLYLSAAKPFWGGKLGLLSGYLNKPLFSSPPFTVGSS
jgi:hypothetical protein